MQAQSTSDVLNAALIRIQIVLAHVLLHMLMQGDLIFLLQRAEPGGVVGKLAAGRRRSEPLESGFEGHFGDELVQELVRVVVGEKRPRAG